MVREGGVETPCDVSLTSTFVDPPRSGPPTVTTHQHSAGDSGNQMRPQAASPQGTPGASRQKETARTNAGCRCRPTSGRWGASTYYGSGVVHLECSGMMGPVSTGWWPMWTDFNLYHGLWRYQPASRPPPS